MEHSYKGYLPSSPGDASISSFIREMKDGHQRIISEKVVHGGDEGQQPEDSLRKRRSWGR
jgi:hypothetical protein